VYVCVVDFLGKPLDDYVAQLSLIRSVSVYVCVVDFLGKPLDDYVAQLPVPTYIERMGTRSGLIRARLRGRLTALEPQCLPVHGDSEKNNTTQKWHYLYSRRIFLYLILLVYLAYISSELGFILLCFINAC